MFYIQYSNSVDTAEDIFLTKIRESSLYFSFYIRFFYVALAVLEDKGPPVFSTLVLTIEDCAVSLAVNCFMTDLL